MAIDQLSVFVENRQGRLVEVLESLGASGIDIRALSLADTADFGVLRLIVDKPALAMQKLSDIGCVVKINQVLPVSISDEPGSLGKTLRVLADNGINVEYTYAFVAHGDNRAFVILRVDDDFAAETILRKAGIKLAQTGDVIGG